MAVTEQQENDAYDAQKEWITKNIGPKAASDANYGWGVDEINEVIETKVYGYGVLVTHIPTQYHDWNPYKEET